MSRSSIRLVLNALLVLFLSFTSPVQLPAADETVQYLGQFADDAYVEIEGSEGLLDLNKDFTIEMRVSWQPSPPRAYFAGNEAWPGMSDQIKVQTQCGWVLRKIAGNDFDELDFTFACKGKNWVRVKGRFRKTTDTVHLAVSRDRDVISLFANGQIVAQKNVSGFTIVPSPTPLYLGPRNHGHQRTFNGTISFFRLANVALYRNAPFQPPSIEEPGEHDLVFYSFRRIKGGKLIDQTGFSRNGVTRPTHNGDSHNVRFTQK